MALKTPSRYLPEPTPDRRAAARVLFEAVPLSTVNSVAAECGVMLYWVRRWRREGGWKKAAVRVPDLSARAGEAANKFKTKMSELGKPLNADAGAQDVAADVSEQFAVDVRAQVVDRHRKEWAAPRKIAYDAIQESSRPGGSVEAAFERAKLAKITAETLTLVQVGECRAYGINHDARGGDGSTVVVVERGVPNPPVPPRAPPLDAAQPENGGGTTLAAGGGRQSLVADDNSDDDGEVF